MERLVGDEVRFADVWFRNYFDVLDVFLPRTIELRAEFGASIRLAGCYKYLGILRLRIPRDKNTAG